MARKPTLRVLVDSREKKPLLFPRTPTMKCALKAGDYSLYGYQEFISVEYKSAGDWIHWINPSRARRLINQCAKLSRLSHKVIVVGGRLGRLDRYSHIPEDIILYKTSELLVSHNIPVVFTSGRLQAAKFILTFLKEAKKSVDAISQFN